MTFHRYGLSMYDALLILAFFLVGIPGGTWLWLQFRDAQKREQTAYDWSQAEIARRTMRLDELERAFADTRATIGGLMNDVTRLHTEQSRLEAIIGEAGNARGDDEVERRPT